MESKAVITQVQMEKDLSASTVPLLTQQNGIFQNIDEIISKIMKSLVEHLFSKKDNVAGSIDENVVKMMADIYNQFHKRDKIACSELRSMLQTLFEMNNDANDSITKNC